MPESAATAGRHAPMLRLLALLPPTTRSGMVRKYAQMLRSEPAAIAAMLARGAEIESAAVVHKLAGSAAMMQDTDLSQPARELENALLAGDRPQADLLLATLHAAAAATLGTLATLAS